MRPGKFLFSANRFRLDVVLFFTLSSRLLAQFEPYVLPHYIPGRQDPAEHSPSQTSSSEGTSPRYPSTQEIPRPSDKDTREQQYPRTSYIHQPPGTIPSPQTNNPRSQPIGGGPGKTCLEKIKRNTVKLQVGGDSFSGTVTNYRHVYDAYGRPVTECYVVTCYHTFRDKENSEVRVSTIEDHKGIAVAVAHYGDRDERDTSLLKATISGHPDFTEIQVEPLPQDLAPGQTVVFAGYPRGGPFEVGETEYKSSFSKNYFVTEGQDSPVHGFSGGGTYILDSNGGYTYVANVKGFLSSDTGVEGIFSIARPK